MYFAMDEIGFENSEWIKTIAAESDKWQFIYDTAQAYGFDGIHLSVGYDIMNWQKLLAVFASRRSSTAF